MLKVSFIKPPYLFRKREIPFAAVKYYTYWYKSIHTGSKAYIVFYARLIYTPELCTDKKIEILQQHSKNYRQVSGASFIIKRWIMKNRSINIIPFKSDLRINKILLIADIISGVLLILFLYTSISKLTGYERFKIVLSTSPLLKPVAGIIAWLLPVTEIVIAIMLFLPFTRVKGLKASSVLIFIFTLYLVYMVAFTTQLPCNCGGVLQFLTWPQHIFFNLLFILLAIAGILFYKKNINRQCEPPP